MSARTAIALVAGRELTQRLRSRGFRVGTAIIAVLAAGLALLPALLPEGTERWRVALVGAAPPALPRVLDDVAASASAEAELAPRPAGDPAVLVRGDDIDAVLVGGRELLIDADAGSDLRNGLTGALVRARLIAAVGEPAAVDEARAIAVREVGDPGDGAGEALVRFAGVLVMFFAIASYGTWVLNSVLEEKSNRVVELVVSTLDPRHLLAGKVIGTGLAGLAQLVAVVVAALAAGLIGGTWSELSGTGIVTAVATLGWFLLGYAFYATGYAAAGALVSRQEDAQSASTPMMMLAMTAYLVSTLVVNPAPGGTAARVLSLLPPLTPLAMPTRIAAGEVAAWEVALSVVLMLLATWGVIRLGARVYTNALLRTGAPVPIREALRRRPSPAGG